MRRGVNIFLQICASQEEYCYFLVSDGKINQICSWMCLDEETFCTLLMELVELELSLPRPSSVTISSTIFEKELVPFQFHQNWN